MARTRMGPRSAVPAMDAHAPASPRSAACATTPPVIPLTQVIAPPYDVIEPAERTRLATRSSFNSVHLELPEPDLRAGLDRYQVAARLLAAWRNDGVLVLDERARLLPVPDDRRPTASPTLGVIGALGLPEPDEEGQVLPHEETLPKPRSDRLDLLIATEANLSPIWGLSLTDGLSSVLSPGGRPRDRRPRRRRGAPRAVGGRRGRHGADHRSRRRGAGRHRRRAPPLRDRPRLPATGPGRAGAGRPGGHDWVMALIVELAEDQLAGPADPPGHQRARVAAAELIGGFSKWFDVVRAGDGTDRVAAALGEAASLAVVTNEDALAAHAPARGLRRRQQRPRLQPGRAGHRRVSPGRADLAPPQLAGGHGRRSASGDAQAAVLLRPPTVAQISAWAHDRRRMPPKTTYFSPKPRTGMVFRPLERLSRAQSTVQVEPDRSSASRSPAPRCSWARTIWRDISSPYSGRSTARKTPIGVGS